MSELVDSEHARLGRECGSECPAEQQWAMAQVTITVCRFRATTWSFLTT